MRGGYYYQHDLAKDSYIRVLKTFQIKPGEWVVKCALYTMPSPLPWQQVRFRITRDKQHFWKLFTPRST